MVGGAIRSKLIHRMSYRASVLHQLWTKRGENNTAREFSALTTPSLLSRDTRRKIPFPHPPSIGLAELAQFAAHQKEHRE
jgi:hypothetical protein